MNWRKEVGYEFVDGELELTGKNLCIVCTVGWVGAFAAAFSGTGPGSIFCPAIILIGVNPQVATATGMYITLFTTLASTIVVIIMKRILIDYMWLVLFMTFLGTFPGIFF